MAINTFRLLYEIASMHSKIGEAPQWHKKKAGALIEAMVKTFNFFALNDTRRLDMAQGSMDGYTPLPSSLRTPFVHGDSVKFRYYKTVKRVPKVGVEAVLHPLNTFRRWIPATSQAALLRARVRPAAQLRAWVQLSG